MDVKEFIVTDREINSSVNHPSHYNSGRIETIDIINEIVKDYDGETAFDLGNVIKYISRSKRKNGLEDLEKARWYLNRAIKTEKNKISEE